MDGLEVLVAGSTPERSQRLVESLRAQGYQVAVESDPEAVARGLATDAPDLVVLDLALPDLDFGLLRQAMIGSHGAAPPEPLETVERRHIEFTLRFTGGNKRRAAYLLGIARSTLIQKVRKHALEPPRGED